MESHKGCIPPYNKGEDKRKPHMTFITETLTPILERIETKMTESYSLQALGMEDMVSSQSILIQFGNRMEFFWNKVMETNGVSLIASTPKTYYKVGAKKGQVRLWQKNDKVGSRQVDLFFTDKNGNKVYCEMKCCLNFDTEKVKASDEKVTKVGEALGADKSYYFCPVLDVISDETQAMVSHTIIGVSDILEMVDAPFTSEELFSYLATTASDIMKSKGL